MSNDQIDREKILGASARDYHFDRQLRGYDTKQVDDYIASLEQNHKSAIGIFEERIEDLKNKNNMLSYELEQTKANAEKYKKLFEEAQKRGDEELEKSKKEARAEAESEKTATLNAEIDRLKKRNNELAEKNKKLEDEARSMQRDIAHLTKKVDKNRSKIKDLTESAESGISDEQMRKYSDMVSVYEAAIDKAEDLIYRLQTELSLAHSKAEDITARIDGGANTPNQSSLPHE